LEERFVLETLIGEQVVIDMSSAYVCLGTLRAVDEAFLELRNADLHDLRDTDTSRENYVAASRATGIKRNRKSVLVARREVIAIGRLDDVVDE
jgi:small nuclear ribonucleoprotein (snRNP)-like protein